MQANSSSQVALFSSLKKGGDGGYCLDTALMGKKGRKETKNIVYHGGSSSRCEFLMDGG